MISRLNDRDVFRFAKRIAGLAAVAAVALSFTGLTQAQLKPSEIDSTAVRPSPTAYAGIPAGAQSVVSATLGKADEAYRAKSSGQGYATENPANHLAAQYADDGVKFRFQNANLDLEFQGWGYGKTSVKQDPAAVAPFVDANRVEYRRGALTEWYVNGPLGIEQGFTISQEPVAVASPDSQHDVLDIALRLRGNLSASIEPGRHALTLRDQKGVETLRYGPLLAYDASGRELESWMEVQDGSLQLRVNTAGARYPIIVDPWVQAAELTVSSGVSTGIGRSVAVSGNGNIIVVSASGTTIGGNAEQGAVFVFVASTGVWTSTSSYAAELYDPAGLQGDDFGLSVSINASGDTIVVGAPQTQSTYGGPGLAYVFVEPTGGWALEPTPPTYNAKLTSSDGTLFGEFGWSVANGENTVVVGAFANPFNPRATNYEQGEAYVFAEPLVLGVPTWSSETETAKLIASDGREGDSLGISVGIDDSGDTVVAGSIDATVTAVYQGAAYVFSEPTLNGVPTGWVTPTGSPNFTAKLVASDAAYASHLGWAVGIDSGGDTIVASAYQAPIGGNAAQGAAYVFVEPTGGWALEPTSPATQTVELIASDGAADDEFGTSVAISGNTVVVGADSTAEGVGTGASAAYVFVAPGGWALEPTSPVTQTAELTTGATGDAFGNAVAIGGNTVVVSAEGATNASGFAQGAAYVFTGSSAPYAQYSIQGVPTQGLLINFGSVNVNSTSTVTLTLTNPDSPAFTVSGVSLSGISSAFSITNVACTGSGNTVTPPYTSMTVTLAQGDVCTITLQFAPILVQNNQAEALSIATSATTSNAAELPGGGGQGFSLEGQGVQPIATFSPTQVNFGNVVDNVPATQPVTVTNTGNGTLIIDLVLPSALGTGLSDPQYTCTQGVTVSTPSYPITLNPTDSCTYTTQFDPTAPGPASIGLGFGDNAGVGESNLTSVSYGTYFVQSVPLSGTGVTSIAGIATTTTINSTASSYMGYALPSGYALVGNPITVNYTVLPVSGSANATGTVIVEDGSEEFCTPPGTLTSNNGKGSCPLTINALGGGSTPLSAQYTPDSASSSNGLLGSATIAPLFTETVVEIINCGSLAAPQSVPPGTPITFTNSICLASGLVGVDAVQAVVSGGCPTNYYTCNATVAAVPGQSGVYTVVVTITPTGAGGIVPLHNHPPLTGLPSQMFFGFGLLLAALLALQFGRRNRARPKFAYAAGLVIVVAMLLGGVNSCSSGSAKTPTGTGTYTIDVTISAGTYNVTVPLSLTVTQ